MVFSRQGYWSREPFPSPGDLADPGIEFESPALQADSLPSKPHSMWDLNFPTKDQNLSPVLWKHRVLTTGPPWKSLTFSWFLNDHMGSDTTQQLSHIFCVMHSNRYFLLVQLSFTLTRALKNGLYKTCLIVGKEQISEDGGAMLSPRSLSLSPGALWTMIGSWARI